MADPVGRAIVLGGLPFSIRPGGAADLAGVAAIQRACPEAAQWETADYLDHDFLVAIAENAVAGFVVSRRLAGDEREILNLAVAPEFRRKRIGQALLKASLEGFRGVVFLEVRESNQTALSFYKSLNFKVISRRKRYYDFPLEAAIVLKFHSC